ncbi:MAG: hypothetical protein IPP99_04010 [Chitinophagaceae bacterium]|nr:hypothetical protein [Chitinophagaceae bacterium]
MGNNLKFNRIGWGGNGATGARKEAQLFSKRLGYVTKGLGAITTGLSLYQTVDDLQNGNYKAAAVHGTDAVMGVIAFLGPIGAGISGLYFLSRFFWGN